MLTDAYLNRLARRAWLLHGPLHQLIDSYIFELARLRYARGTVGASLRSRSGKLVVPRIPTAGKRAAAIMTLIGAA
jgi:hypothetical protein